MAVRLAQELGLNETELYTQHGDGLTHTWVEERYLRTWLYAFNADRHIALRRGKSNHLRSLVDRHSLLTIVSERTELICPSG